MLVSESFDQMKELASNGDVSNLMCESFIEAVIEDGYELDDEISEAAIKDKLNSAKEKIANKVYDRIGNATIKYGLKKALHDDKKLDKFLKKTGKTMDDAFTDDEEKDYQRAIKGEHNIKDILTADSSKKIYLKNKALNRMANTDDVAKVLDSDDTKAYTNYTANQVSLAKLKLAGSAAIATVLLGIGVGTTLSALHKRTLTKALKAYEDMAEPKYTIADLKVVDNKLVADDGKEIGTVDKKTVTIDSKFSKDAVYYGACVAKLTGVGNKYVKELGKLIKAQNKASKEPVKESADETDENDEYTESVLTICEMIESGDLTEEEGCELMNSLLDDEE